MKKWLKRVRGAVLMGVTWALIWMPIGLLIGAIVDPDGTMDEPWILVGALPGFLAGVIFSIVLGIAAGRRKLDDLSVEKVGGWGALAGLLLGMLPFLLGDHGPDKPRILPLELVIVASITALSAISAAGSLVLARKAARPQLSDGSDDALLGEGEFVASSGPRAPSARVDASRAGSRTGAE